MLFGKEPQDMKKEKIFHWHKSIFLTTVLIFLLGAASYFMASHINQLEEDDCFDNLHDAVETLSNDINACIERDRSILRTIANIIAEYDELDPARIKSLLASYDSQSMLSQLGVLFPDNTVLLEDGTSINADGILSFSDEAALGEHITDEEDSLLESDLLVLRNYVPVIQNGQTVAMLYGTISLDTLPDLWNHPSIYDGRAAIYLINADNGNFLVDTWHKTLGNIYDLGQREMKKGYHPEQLTYDLVAGKSGHVVFVSKTVGEYLYFYYEPISVNNWTLALSVPESIAFARADAVKQLLYYFAAFECVCFVLYFIWMFFYIKREAYDKQKRVEFISYIHDVEKTLFTAHQKNENIESALKRIGDMTTARTVFFKIYAEDRVYCWNENDAMSVDIRTLPDGNGLFTDIPGAKKNLMAIQITDVDDEPIGCLGAYNMKHSWSSTELLDAVALSFSMLYHNMRSFSIIQKMGTTDTLTGLLNRNSFELRLDEYQLNPPDALTCIYADVNGLHDMNNTQGHKAGDEMLRFIGGAMQKQFGSSCTYRIGGDEFLAFTDDKTPDAIEESILHIKQLLKQRGYHASFGVERLQDGGTVDELIKAAEQKMYREKRSYYEKLGIPARIDAD